VETGDGFVDVFGLDGSVLQQRFEHRSYRMIFPCRSHLLFAYAELVQKDFKDLFVGVHDR
jgi:hypothetical protein